jgi:hypothetical protein
MWVKTYEAFIYEGGKSSNEVAKLEKILKLPANSGVITDVSYDKSTATLNIEQPRDMNPMDSGAVLAAISKEKQNIKKEYPGIKMVAAGDLQISIK